MKQLQQDKPQAGILYSMSGGRLTPLASAGLPRGAVVSYGDALNPRLRSVVLGPSKDGQRQEAMSEHGHISHVSRNCIEGPGGWRDEHETLTEPQVLAFIEEAEATRQRREREAAEEAAAKAAEDKAAVSALKAAHPYLELAATSKKSGHACAAANIRRLLRRAFPGQKFSVTSDAFSMGDSVDVSWEDGPSTKEVDAIISPFEDSGFDGMQDLSYAVDSPWHVFGSAKFVHSSRHVTEARFAAVAAELCPGCDAAAIAADLKRGAHHLHEDGELIRREAWKRSYYEAPAAPAAPAKRAPAPAAGEGVTVSALGYSLPPREDLPASAYPSGPVHDGNKPEEELAELY